MYREFHEHGFKVFGIHGADENGLCKCGYEKCDPKALHKHPIAKAWQYTPNWSDEQFEVMESTGQFSSGYGILVDGYLVIDIDVRNGGKEGYTQLVEDFPSVTSCGLIVATGSNDGSKHLFFKLKEKMPLVQNMPKYKGIDFKSTGYVVGAGSMHRSGHRYEILVGGPGDIGYAPDDLLDALKKSDTYRANLNGKTYDISDAEIADMLSYINPDVEYDVWIRVGMAVHHATMGTGYDLWDDWSREGSKYGGNDVNQRHWHSFSKRDESSVTLGTLWHYATQAGWVRPVTFDPTDAPTNETQKQTDEPFIDTSDVDLLRPPGFVGELARWINDQCRYPREHLAVAAAITAMGNVAGLRYKDGLDGIGLNVFSFCVSASSTGKEAVQQAMAEIHRAAGIHLATHGSIKSEQEIIRNLTRHQAAYYIIDEIGILLTKIENARKRGGAAYLDGVIGQLMAAYSKATGFMLLTGDTKEEVRKQLSAELAQARKKVAENEDEGGYNQRRIPSLQRALDQIDNGLERPFLSLIGFTTPVTFESIVNREQVENGFIARSIITNERETNPRAKRGFRKRPMPYEMDQTLKQVYHGGEFNGQITRVEYYNEQVRIDTDDEAQDMLDTALTYFEEKAEEYKSTNGFEAVPRRGYEMVAKISCILAAPTGLRTAEHVKWAFALVIRDIEEKARLAFSNEDGNDEFKRISARIMNIISADHGETFAVIANRLSKTYRREDVQRAVDVLIEKGVITKSTQENGNHRSEKYFLA